MLKAVELVSNKTRGLSKKVTLKPMTYRTVCFGTHQVEVMINGRSKLFGDFDLMEQSVLIQKLTKPNEAQLILHSSNGSDQEYIQVGM